MSEGSCVTEVEVEVEERTGMDRLKAWLDREGLGGYAFLFRFHCVDDEVLPLLTLRDLKAMGICPDGTRRKIYQFIQKSCQNSAE
ncbi:hypothetical protein F511_46247 [Dorcoceras hygrometricum]|uniref:SAM domain-containing protein n=1 Tax=Dorcoceras hygrometricum TaxID=472368 RepID=A0A2Z7A0Y4_9LAMI|nr:hypothetical protein F511_46247 [Dorcoceras hygrometricum]